MSYHFWLGYPLPSYRSALFSISHPLSPVSLFLPFHQPCLLTSSFASEQPSKLSINAGHLRSGYSIICEELIRARLRQIRGHCLSSLLPPRPTSSSRSCAKFARYSAVGTQPNSKPGTRRDPCPRRLRTHKPDAPATKCCNCQPTSHQYRRRMGIISMNGRFPCKAKEQAQVGLSRVQCAQHTPNKPLHFSPSPSLRTPTPRTDNKAVKHPPPSLLSIKSVCDILNPILEHRPPSSRYKLQTERWCEIKEAKVRRHGCVWSTEEE